MIEFNREDYRCDAFEERVKEEAQLIYDKPSTRHGRTLVQVQDTVRIGHFAEWFLLQHKGWADNPAMFMDIINEYKNELWTEVKVTDKKENVEYVIENANNMRDQLVEWGKPYSRALVIFTNNHKKDSPIYKFHSYYELEEGILVKKEFTLTEKCDIIV